MGQTFMEKMINVIEGRSPCSQMERLISYIKAYLKDEPPIETKSVGFFLKLDPYILKLI